jgi:protocatechuate 3,4-dioxygenase, beta subunit
MKKTFKMLSSALLLSGFIGCSGQKVGVPDKARPVIPPVNSTGKPVGGGCDGCELMYVGMPKNINAVDTSAIWHEKGQKLLVTGKVFKIDGKTPAPNVVIYYWQTDNTGYYTQKPDLIPAAKKHGYVRGWIKTDKDGNYAIYTIKPAPYPNDQLPSHIHTSIKEPNVKNEYYIDEFVFDDDPLLTTAKRKALENRGGSGIMRVVVKGDLQIAEHNIILGLNIPNYPENNPSGRISGLEIGEDNSSFIPYHAFGPDKGTRTCPVCKYGRFHGIVYFVGNKPDWAEIKKWLTFLEQESTKRSKYLKAYFVYGNEKDYNKDTRKKELESIGKEQNLKNIALTFVPSMGDLESEVNLNKINPNVANTFIIYRHRTIVGKFIDLPASKENFEAISNVLDKTKSEYFNLSEPKHD